MKARTESEVKAYADGYKACYKEFCQCLKNNTAEQAIKKMGVFVVVVNNCVEVAEQTEPTTEDCSMVDCKYYRNPDYERCMECKKKQSVNLSAEVKGSERSVKGLTKINQELNQDPLHDDCFDCDKFFTCDNKGEDYKTDCPWK